MSKTMPIQEEPHEPEDDPCQPCSQAQRLDIVEQSHYPNSGESEAISRYVFAMRTAIKKQGERLQQEEAREAGQEGSPAEKESEKPDFHIKASQKTKPPPLLLTTEVHGKDILAGLRSKARRVTFILPKKSAEKGSKSEVQLQEPKRVSSLSLLARHAKARFAAIGSTGKPVSVLFPPVRSKLRKQSERRPKIKSNHGAASAPSLAEKCTNGEEGLASPDEAYADDEEVDEHEEVALLSLRSSSSSSRNSFEAFHFYTPMFTSRSRCDYEYRLEESRFRKSIGFSRDSVSRGVSSLKHHTKNVLWTRRRGGGWSRLK
ncbi:hypothetical protein A1O7_07643 [Cladophialophora yegresii CBS 114405]|uniref:Uncharacterized protein n=1 Tax=Cladophialophora yegresii CBS 114405 TaxID=1182544 RepID=W9VYG8_9EURO|nr:uncharacterized protein A1O7_07643 [Cladophialophora yegresii CBS 114405]EXJ57296.1 hypothetical protein A1O7_07643 [Cladophialophora yegresii CBS 114405]